MRRLTALALIFALMSLTVAASANQTENYKDKFTSISWAGSDGTLPWPGPWSEIGDDGDQTRGNVRVVSSGNCASGNCIRMSALTTLLGQIGARRFADTSGFEDLSLRFDLCSTPSLLGSEIEVQVTDGGGWVTVAEYQLGPGIDIQPTFDISAFRSEDFGIRLMFSGVLLSSQVFIDDIEVSGTIVPPTTTTTTTLPPTTTTTTIPATTTTTQAGPTTSTTLPGSTTTTTTGDGDGGTDSGSGGGSGSTTTTTISTTSTTEHDIIEEDGPGGVVGSPTNSSTTTSTTIVEAAGGPELGGGGGGLISTGSGIRAATRGLQANFQDVYGEFRPFSSLNGVDFQADYNMAVEVIESSWAWIVLLGLVVAYSIISGLDRRKGDLGKQAL